MRKEGMKLLKTVLIFGALVIGVDKGFGIIMDTLYFQQGRPYVYGIEKANEDILILGASRALHHYVPSIIEDSLQMTCFNFGSGGQNIYYHYGILKAALSRYTPKLVIIDVFEIDFYKTPGWNTEKLSIFNPAYYRDTALKEVIDLRGKNEKIKLMSSFYRYNGEVIRIINYALLHNNVYFTKENEGYIPLHGIWKDTLVSEKSEKKELDKQKLHYLRNCIQLCKEKEIPLVICISPCYVDKKGNDRLFSQDISKEHQVHFFNYEQNAYFLAHRELFRDVLHLNYKGAEIYTNCFINNISNYMDESNN